MTKLRWRGIFLALLVLVLCGSTSAALVAAQGPEESLTIVVSSPAQGETFYTAEDGFRLSVPIMGQVISYDAPLHPETVAVTLELVDSSGASVTYNPTLDDTGAFAIWASILDPNLPWPSDDPHVEDTCGECHRTEPALPLPDDVTQLVVHAEAADGRTGTATRNVQLDRGTLRPLLVEVTGLPDDVTEAQVVATTLIYDWRRRSFYGTVADGQAALRVEGLLHADLAYEIALQPVIVAGTRYTSPVETFALAAGQNPPTGVTLSAQPERASITGRVLDGPGGDGRAADVLAVDLTTGAGVAVEAAADGTFTLADLPVAPHALLARVPDAFHLPQQLDLTETLDAETRITLTAAGEDSLRGAVLLNGAPLPFAEVTVAGLPAAYADPLTGAFALDAVPAGETLTVQVAAAGCYAVELTTSERDLGEVALTLHDETIIIEHSGARLYWPAQSTVTQQGDVFTLESGVLWAQPVNGAVADPVVVRVGAATLSGSAASFAVERVAGAVPRLYVREGSVTVAWAADAAPSVTVAAGQTLALADASAAPVALVTGAGPVLRAVAGPVAHVVWEPSAAERLEEAAWDISTIVARVLMVMAYAIVFGGLPGTLLLVLVVGWRRRGDEQGG